MVSLGSSGCSEFVVWSPITGGEVRRLPMPCLRSMWLSAALLCASTFCDEHHLDCGYGAFAVVLVATHSNKGLTSVYIYSSEQHVWSRSLTKTGVCRSSEEQEDTLPLLGKQSTSAACMSGPPNSWRTNCASNNYLLLAYRLWASWIFIYSMPSRQQMTASLGYSWRGTQNSLWLRKAAPDGDADWTQKRVFELDKMLPSWDLSYRYNLFAAPSSNGVTVISLCGVLFTIDLKSGRVSELLEGRRADKDIYRGINLATN
ncbi:hypothetical protein EJB05_50595, partial [Eragrostis curvula]